MSILHLMGFVFVIALISGYLYMLNTRGEVILNPVKVDKSFSREFSRVISKSRLTPMIEAEFVDPDGDSVDWGDFDGQYVLVNFWATWCPPCVVELPSLDRLQRHFKGRGLEVIAVSMDQQRTQKQIKDFLYSRNIGNFAAHWDYRGEVRKKVYMRGLPTSYLLDPKGNILHIFEGDANWASPISMEFFSELLNTQK